MMIPANHAAFLIADVSIQQDAGGNSWVLPQSAADWVTLKNTEYDRLKGLYCLSPGAEIQTGLKAESRNGLRYFLK